MHLTGNENLHNKYQTYVECSNINQQAKVLDESYGYNLDRTILQTIPKQAK